MAATQGRSSSATKGSNGGVSLETKMLVPVLALLAVLSLFPFFYIIWMSLNIVSLINGISFDFAGLANWTRMFTDRPFSAWSSPGTTTPLRRPSLAPTARPYQSRRPS